MKFRILKNLHFIEIYLCAARSHESMGAHLGRFSDLSPFNKDTKLTSCNFKSFVAWSSKVRKLPYINYHKLPCLYECFM